MRMTSSVLAGLLLMGACQSSPPPRTQWKPPEERPVVLLRSELALSSKVPARTVQGVVVRAETGKPLSNALVSVYAEGIGELGQTTSDSSGYFSFTDLPAQTTTLRADFFGTRAREFSLNLDTVPGYAVRFALEEVPGCLCATLKDPRAVTVLARDVVTGEAPSSVATLRLTDGAYEDVVGATPTSGDSLLVLRSSTWRRGTYLVEVTADGYENWVQDSVIVRSGGCGGNLQPQVVSAWLLPK